MSILLLAGYSPRRKDSKLPECKALENPFINHHCNIMVKIPPYNPLF